MTAVEHSSREAQKSKKRNLFKAVLFPSWPLETRESFLDQVIFIHPTEKAIIFNNKTP